MNTNLNLTIENKTNFQLYQVTVKAQTNEALFKLIEQAIERKPVQMIVTPRIDVAGYPYYWVGIRSDYRELNFKLQVNDQIMNYILAYLKGDEQLPTVSDFNPTEKIENVAEWLECHEMKHFRSSLYDKEELSMKEGINYLTRKFVYLNGKINYPSTKCDDALSILLG
ncbi:MAG: hypothetical protein LBM20_05005 [Rikenellaceae bacterium]|jgi:hypothetical protein|nr:hypothetical protein [Rikenellaceae bacterium]